MNEYAVKLLVHELSKFRCDIIGIAESHRLGVEEIDEGEFKILESGREEGAHRSGVALALSRVAQGALVGYNPISDHHGHIRVVYWRVDSNPSLCANG